MNSYRECFEHLGPPTTGGHTPDDVEMLDELTDALTLSSAKNVLEIGFNRGGSALAFLLNGVTVTSIDIADNSTSVDYLTKTFGTQFTFILSPSNTLPQFVSGQQFDLVYIDGNHEDPHVDNDVNTCISLGIPYLLFDDTLHSGHRNIRTIVNHGIKTGRWTLVKEYTAGCGKTLVKIVK